MTHGSERVATSADCNLVHRSWTRYKMNRPLFMRRYTIFFESIRQNPSNPHIDADTLKWLPLMYMTVSSVPRA